MHRIESLDGLRGLAAITVLIHHGLLLFPFLAEPYYTHQPADSGTFAWWMLHTPIHALWEGKAGVYIFFVLSGLVLTLPALGRRPFDWVAYYPSRLVRLYLPVWAAVAFAVVTIFLVPRITPSGMWLEERPDSVTLVALMRDLTLVAGNGGLVSPLWSLTWEVLFSLALPIAIVVCIRMPRFHWLILIACVAVTSAGGIVDETFLIYPPMFVIGVIIAIRRESIAKWCERLSTAAWVVVAVVATLAISSRWLLMAFGAGRELSEGTTGLMLVGSGAFVVMALEWRVARRFLSVSPLRTLGLFSFSLYLVHEPIIVAAGFAMPGQPLAAFGVAVALSAVMTPLFYYCVEKPSHKLSVMIRNAIRDRQHSMNPSDPAGVPVA